jgi:hypothetical protein
LYDNERKAKHCEEECRRFQDNIQMLKRQRMKALEELKHRNLDKMHLHISKTAADLHKMVKNLSLE